MSDINLKDLAFTAEDFYEFANDETIVGLRFAKSLADKANSILTEKLKKAPELYGPSEWYLGRWTQVTGPHQTHTARLVCIEKIEK